MPAGAMPEKPMQALSPYLRKIGPFLIPCVVLTGYLMATASVAGLRAKRANREMEAGSGHH